MTGRTIKSMVASCLISVSALAFAEQKIVYISPNHDGVQDSLEIPLKIKEKRYVKEWTFIVFDHNYKVIRTIGNKVSLPQKFSFKMLWKAILSTKRGVEIPSKIVWNGFCDDGSVAPDGTYYYQLMASDDNGNIGQTDKYTVVVDNTPPQVTLKVPADKTFGQNVKAFFKIGQEGSTEKLWSGKITDSEGNTVRSFTWDDASPMEIEWNGTDDKSAIVPDGVYNYEITSTDLAGNSEKQTVTNIIFSAEKPEVAASIDGGRFFAPAPRGKRKPDAQKNIKFRVSVPDPKESVNSLTGWKIAVLDKNSGKEVFSESGKANPPENFTYDGKSSDASFLKDGEYQLKVTAKYLNGYEPEPALSAVFVVDNSPAEATIKLPSNSVFNGKENYVISQKEIAKPAFTGEKKWTGRIVDSNGNTVRTYDFASKLPDSVEWNGLNDEGQFAEDGKYTYAIDVEDNAGNIGNYVSATSFTLDTSKTELALSVAPVAFSPKGNSPLKTITITPVAKANSGIESYSMKISDEKGNAVRTFTGSGSIPASFTWNGLADDGSDCAEGSYSAKIETVANSGTKAEASSTSFIIDNTPPSLTAKADFLLFSPDGISSRQKLPVKISDSTVEDTWLAEIKNKDNETVKTLAWTSSKAQDFAWDGTDDSGIAAANGTYRALISSRDKAGNFFTAEIDGITLDTRAVTAIVTAENKGFSPNGDGFLDTQKFDFHVAVKDNINSWKFEILNEKNAVTKTFTSDGSASDVSVSDVSVSIPESITWKGDTDDGKTAEGVFRGKLTIDYEKGNKAETTSTNFICTTVPPQLSVVTSPKYFSPDNDGDNDELLIRLKCTTLANIENWSYVIKDRNGSQFWKTSGKKTMTEKILWDGRGYNGELVQSAEDYPYELTVKDDLGMTSRFEGTINVDILVIRDGNKLKMQIPSIIFRSEHADFGVTGTLDQNKKTIEKGITKQQADNNERILKRVAEVLKKFGDYKVTVVGHANRVTEDPEEETVEGKYGRASTPLSKERAEFVRKQLIKKGISGGRLSVDGMGGKEPIADWKNKSVNWKNRRVEFILEK